MSCVSIDLIGSGNTLFPDSLLPVMRKALYIQRVTNQGCYAAHSFSFSTEAYKINEKKTQTDKQKNQ